METQTFYQNAIKFATAKHEDKSQKVKGTCAKWRSTVKLYNLTSFH